MIKAGDLVKLLDIPGTGTGILYRVLSIGEEREYYVLRRINGCDALTPELTRKVKLQPAIVVFESKLVTGRANVTHYLCDLRPVDLVEMGAEYTKLGLLIQDEARRLVGEPRTPGCRTSSAPCRGTVDRAPRKPQKKSVPGG